MYDRTMSFLTQGCSPGELKIQVLPRFNSQMRFESCGGVICALPQTVLDVVHGNMVQEIVAESCFELCWLYRQTYSRKIWTGQLKDVADVPLPASFRCATKCASVPVS